MSRNRGNAFETLGNLRTRLLDLTARNRLINYRYTKNGSLRIIDELPDQLVETLLADKEMRFEAILEPTQDELIDAGYLKYDEEKDEILTLKNTPSAEEWAKYLGFATSYEVPEPSEECEEKHSDLSIQTLLYPYEMESKLKSIYYASESAIQEMGANILYFAFGFLEWYDSGHENERIAPLFLIPVKISKGSLNAKTNTYEYTIQYSGEGIIPNLSLREKLREDFGLALPELGEETTPEDYFQEVEDTIIANQPKWRTRRHISLTMLNFSKLLMYLDLDPERWPDDNSIIDHNLISGFLEGYEGDENKEEQGTGDLGFGEEYSIDEVEDIHSQYPIIYDADSSQHSALIDAINGKNLVIEGPPGTGKSQTITNIIAAAIAQGKRVLFVAEKLAALEVVRRRLDEAKLGHFCLELHSHKSQKRKVLDEVEKRLKMHGKFRKPSEIRADIDHYEQHKEKLMAHAKKIGQVWKSTGRTLHDILMAATRYREAIGISPEEFHPKDCNGDNFNASTRRQLLGQVQSYRDVYISVSEQLDDDQSLVTHPWSGVCNTNILFIDQERIDSMLKAWTDAARELLNEAKAYSRTLKQRDELFTSIPQIEKELKFLKRIPASEGNELIGLLPKLRGELLSDAMRFSDRLQQARQIAKEVERYELSNLGDLGSDADAIIQIKTQASRFAGNQITFDELQSARDKLKDCIKHLEDIRPSFEGVSMIIKNLSGLEISATESGLSEFTCLIELVARLEPSLWNERDDIFDNEELDKVVPQIRTELSVIHRLEKELEGKLSTDKLPSGAEALQISSKLSDQSIFRWFKSDWRQARSKLIAHSVDPNIKFDALLDKVSTLVELAEKAEKLAKSSTYITALGKYFKGRNTDIGMISALREWHKAIRDRYGYGFDERARLGDALLKLDSSDARSIRSLHNGKDESNAKIILSNMSVFKAVFLNSAELADHKVELSGKDGLLNRLLDEVDDPINILKPSFGDTDITIGGINEILEKQAHLLEIIQSLKDKDYDKNLFDGRLGIPAGKIKGIEQQLSILSSTLLMAEFFDEHAGEHAATLIYDAPSKETLDSLVSHAEALATAISNERISKKAFSEYVELDQQTWEARCDGSLQSVIDRNQIALDCSQYLQNWLDYLRAREQLDKVGMGSIAKAVEESKITIDQVEDAHLAGIYNLISREILSEDRTMATFSGHSHEAIQKKFVEYDQKLMKLQCEEIAWKADQVEIPRGVNAARVSNKSEKCLLEWEVAKQKRHIPIRQLLHRAGNALAALKPCFMMGPMSVAQYLQPGYINFDLIVMDEASQIKPQDALGAIARGSQLVVVGDPKQLPPTSFFDRSLDEDEEDPAGIEESESILDATLPIFQPARRLRWHYRSQHEKLIAFSNRFFYGNDLVVFPSPHSKMSGYGIQYKRLKSGTFVNQRNMEEARVISEAVREHFKSGNDETLGVVAMNAQQRLNIATAIETLAKDDHVFQELLEKDSGRHESLFIKNLENVQGDERDVIYISMTYGPQEPRGKVFQRFGPINTDVGWRRLNVLFTRSKKRMHIFSSMSSDDVIIGPGSKRGVKALRDFLAYCETGLLHSTEAEGERPPDSDFEISVMSALKDAGYECVPQVGVAGFFIDVAVVDPGNPGKFMMGIECDGATYHSAKSARDRDRLRQSILERLGWEIRRIWSTDWFKNPEAELRPIIRELDQMRTAAQPEPVPEESSVIDEVVAEAEGQQSELQFFVSNEVSLRDALQKFDQEVIRKKYPDTADKERLLRPAMLDALEEFTPTNKAEFLEVIPSYLRIATDGDEPEYLNKVFEIINAYLEESS